MKQVDILLATYNGSLYIDEFLNSIVNQTYQSWRLIIRDDCSSDDTLEKVIKFSRNYPNNVKLIIGERRLGIVKNFSELMLSSSSEYIFFADQDDVWLPNKIEITMSLAEKTENFDARAILIHSDLTVVDKDLNVIAKSFWRYQRLNPARGYSLRDLMIQNIVTGCTMMINRKLLEISLPLPDSARMHDWWLALVACATGNIYYIPQQTVWYRQHGKNDIGAKKYSAISLLARIKNIQKIKASIFLTQAQCCDIYVRYFFKLNKSDALAVLGFCLLQDYGVLARRFLAASLGYRKHGLYRTIAFYFFM